MAEDMGEKTEEPTSQRLSKARQSGNIAKSTDLSAAVDLIGACILVYVFGGYLVSGMADIMRRLLGDASLGQFIDKNASDSVLVWAFTRGALMALPIMLLMMVVAYAAQFQQVKFLLTTEPLQPKLDKLNPVTGFQRLFGVRNVVKTLTNSAKLVIVSIIAVMVVMTHLDAIAGLPMLPLVAAFGVVADMVFHLIAWILATLLVLGYADYMYQKFQHNRDLRMTKQELKDERRNDDGDPEIKARRMRRAREIAMARAKQAVPKADAVVTNPTHFAVALKYDPDTMAAPVVVAKGEDWMAFRIREIAAMHGVPIIERPPLARALYANVPVGRPVRPELFEAVAEVLAYVYRLKQKAAAG